MARLSVRKAISGVVLLSFFGAVALTSSVGVGLALAPTLAAAATVTGADGLTLTSTPNVQVMGSPNGFSLTITDENLSQVTFDSYQISGVPSGWTLKVGGVTLQPVSPDPVIYEVPRADTALTVVPPADFVGTLSGVTVARISDANNLVTDFDGGTFDYLGTSKPQLDSSTTAYAYKDPTAHQAGYCNPVGQYAPCDGSYTIWPTANLNGPDLPHLNNRWADLRSVKAPMPDTDQTASSLVCVNPTFGDYERDPAKANTYQVPDSVSAASGKFLIVNGSQSMPVPNDLIQTTVTGLLPNTTYTFSGYVANVSYDTRNTLPVQSAFYLKSSPNDPGELVGSSQPMPKQAGCENSQTTWTKMTSTFITTDGGEAIIGVRNFGSGGHGNDLAIDQLSLTPMATAKLDLTVEPGRASWQKVDEDNKPLSGSEWTLTPPNGAPLVVVDNGTNDADQTPGSIAVNDLAAGEYTLTETKAPVGYELSAEPKTMTIDADHPIISFGAIENPRIHGTIAWSKTDAADSHALLSGSEWTLVGPDGTSATVVDNGLNDEDPALGKFKVSGLVWGNYELTEAKAPSGYLLSDAPVTLVVDANHTNIVVDPITNTKAVPGMVVKKTADPASGSTVTPGQQITYTVTVANTGNVALTPATLDDDLSDVLDNASYVDGSAAAHVGTTVVAAPVVDVGAAKLHWEAELKVGQTATISYAVTVKQDVSSKEKLVNVVTAGADVPPGITPPTSNCTPATARSVPDCTTSHTPQSSEIPATSPAPTAGGAQAISTKPPSEPSLAYTGAAVIGVGILAGALVLVGATVFFLSRKRQHS